MPNLKPLDPAFHGNFVDHKPVDMAPQMAVEDCFKKFPDFSFFTLNLEFDPAIDEVLHRADHVVPGRDRFNGIAKTHSLDASFVENLSRDHMLFPERLSH